MNDKHFTWLALSVFAVLTAAVVSFNYWIDPLWHYSQSHAFNDVQVVADEREQKTANQLFQPKDADTLLIGSSRSTYINSTAFSNWDVYNYSVANLSMREYHTMLMYAFEHNPDYRRVILGLDFFKINTAEASAPKNILSYDTKVQQSFYRTKNLLSLDVLDYSLQNFRLSATDSIQGDRLYNREGDATAERLKGRDAAYELAMKIHRFEKIFYAEGFEYFPQYKEIMAKVRDTEPQAEKIVYTTPISTELFTSLVGNDLLDEYEVWIRDMVDVYGGVWNFMYPNEITNDLSNYYDGHHFYPFVGDLIGQRIEFGQDAANVPADFGVLVTPENVDAHLADVREMAEELKE